MSLGTSVESVEALQDRVSEGLERVESLLEEKLKGRDDVVGALSWHLAGAGGKRLRPALVLLCAHLGPEGMNEKVVQSAAVVELTHLATLYHDDVIDSAPVRRGVPAAHTVWGNTRAVLAGDLVFARASQLSAGLGERAILQHAATFDRLCMGEIHETFGPGEGDDEIEFYLRVLADKTGSLVAQSARFGAEMSGADLVLADAVAEFGEKIGVAFQLADDVIDLASDGEVSGKTPGTDLREGVDTMPTLLLKRARAAGECDAAGERILALLADERIKTDDEVLGEAVALLREHEVLQHTRDLAFEWCAQGKAALEKLPAGVVKQALVEFADTLVDRIS